MKSFDPKADRGDRIVYVRKMRASETPDQTPAGEHLYSIHDQTGRRLGVAADRDLAFHAARQHEWRPVSVH